MNLVICSSLGLLYISVVVFPGCDFVFSVPVKRLAGKSISKMTYFCQVGCKTLTQSTNHVGKKSDTLLTSMFDV